MARLLCYPQIVWISQFGKKASWEVSSAVEFSKGTTMKWNKQEKNSFPTFDKGCKATVTLRRWSQWTWAAITPAHTPNNSQNAKSWIACLHRSAEWNGQSVPTGQLKQLQLQSAGKGTISQMMCNRTGCSPEPHPSWSWNMPICVYQRLVAVSFSVWK